jgi:hypothetical protein
MVFAHRQAFSVTQFYQIGISSVYSEVWQFLHEKNLLRKAWIVENVTLYSKRLQHGLF